jgi:hypothetical protein
MRFLPSKLNRVLFVCCFSLISTVSYGQNWTEDFESNPSTTYGASDVTISGRVWTKNQAGNFSYANSNAGSYGFTINDDKSNAHITTPELNTCGTVSFKYAYINGSSSNVFQLQISTDGTNFSTLDTHTLGASSNLTYTDYSYNVNNLSTTVFIRILSDDQSGHLFIDDFSVTDFSGSTPGISLGSVSGNTNETGTTATFTAVLNAAPTSDVVVNVTSGDTGEVTVSPSTLTFTNANWDQAQTITVTGVNDALYDDNVHVTITLAVDDTSSDDDYDGISTTTTVTNEDDDLPTVLISEIMYNTPSSDDEWIEIYNGNGADVDISSWTVVYSGGTFTFPGSTTITDGDYLTIALGSNGDGAYNNDNPFTPDYNDLTGSPSNANVKNTNDTNNLGNTSGTITLKNSSGTSIDVVTYYKGDAYSTDGDGPSYEIVDIASDNSNTNTNWQASGINGGTPGYIINTTWSGATDSDWSTSSNWSNGIPVATSNILIPASLTNYPSASGAVTVNSVTINSGASLIAQSTFSGSVTYTRNLATTNWYLVSSPVVGETYDDAYVTANSIASGTGNNRAIALHIPSDDTWDYMQAGESATYSTGTGYATKRSSTGAISFTGTINTDDAGIDVALSNAGNRFNLLGNPYTSHIASATFLTNEGAISETSTLWVWDQSTSAYEVKTIADAMIIAPAQGFFVKANAAGGTFNFDESNQASSGGTFQRPGTRPEIHLTIHDQTDTRLAKIYYIENMTTGFDVGYDGELFNGVSNPLAIFTHLVSDGDGKNYQVQSLPPNNYENTVIPIGINAVSGTDITISALASNLPAGISLFLEDKTDDSFTLLDEESNYSTTLESDAQGIGRYYLHTTSQSLDAASVALNNNISVYKSSEKNLRIVGVQSGMANIYLYNTIGKQVLEASFMGSGVNDIELPELSQGVYIAKLETTNKIITKKIILN